MSNLRLVWKIPSDEATLSASPALTPTLPVANLQDPTRARVARTTGVGSQQILGDLAAAARVNALVLWRHNLSINATWRLELFDGAGQTGTSVYDSGTQVANPPQSLGDLEWGIDPLGTNIFDGWVLAYSVLWLPLTLALSFRLTLSDSGNPDGYMEASRLLLGRYIEPASNADYGAALAWVDESTQIRTAGGTLRTDVGPVYRQLSFNLSWLSEEERPKFMEIMRTRGKRQDLFVSLFPEVGGEKERDYAFVGKVSGQHKSTHAIHNYYRDAFVIQEA